MPKLKYWLYAARPKTLSAALIPVVCASALAAADGTFHWKPAMFCCLFAALMQVAANFINDLYDFLKGTDREDRLGPDRACAQGWISPAEMKRGIAFTLIAACLTGLCLLPYGGIMLIGIGVGCVVFAFLYTTLLSYLGCGDILVWVFFGLVPVCGTYYVQALHLTPAVWWLAAGCGLVSDTLLVLNNYRDRHQDALSGKRTLVVVLGERFGSLLYLAQGILGACCASALIFYGYAPTVLLPLLYIVLHILVWHQMVCIHEGKALNKILGLTSMAMMAFALCITVGLLTAVWA